MGILELTEALKRTENIKRLMETDYKKTKCVKCGKDFFSYKGTKAFCKLCIAKIKSGEIKQ